MVVTDKQEHLHYLLPHAVPSLLSYSQSIQYCTTNNAGVTCEIKLFQNYFSVSRRPSEIILPEII